MILQTAELSPSRKTATAEQAGLNFQSPESVVRCGGSLKMASESQRQNAVQQMRYQLALLDRSQRRMSIEELTAALMGETDADLAASN